MELCGDLEGWDEGRRGKREGKDVDIYMYIFIYKM